jgi:hypothetical protein
LSLRQRQDEANASVRDFEDDRRAGAFFEQPERRGAVLGERFPDLGL